MVEDGNTKRVYLIHQSVKYVPMTPPLPDPEYQSETSQLNSGTMTSTTAVKDDKMVNMASIVVD